MAGTVSLTKGGTVSLSKEGGSLSALLIGLGWDPRVTDGTQFDLDASLFMLKADGKVRNEKDFVFYGNLTSGPTEAGDGAIEHTGDNQDGEGEGDDESIKVNLDLVPADVEKLAVVVTIHDAEARKQSFGQIASPFMRVVDTTSDKEIVRYDLAEDFSTETAMMFGEIYRYNGEWKFRAVGQGYAGGLEKFVRQYGLEVA